VNYRSSKEKLRSLNQARDWLIKSLKKRLLPVLIERGFSVAPLVVMALPTKTSCRASPWGICVAGEKREDLIEVQFARYRSAAFRIVAGTAPKDGLMILGEHCAAEDVSVDWLNVVFEMYAYPRLWAYPWDWGWFSVWHWPGQSPVESDYEELALRVAGLVPELELVSAARGSRRAAHATNSDRLSSTRST
jgi:hypothetical protein